MSDKPSRIALLMSDSSIFSHSYFRQYLTENQDDLWNSTSFIVNPKEGVFDGVIVHQSVKPLDRLYQLVCPPTRTLLVLKEPPNILYLPESFTRQFYACLSQDFRVQSRERFFYFGAYHWYAELSIQQISQYSCLPKTKLISAIVSSKTDTFGHRQRLKFMSALKDYFGDQLDWYGRGINPLGDRKAEGLLNYKYHIVLENSSYPHYWTEKLADAFVCNCFPFYWGCPNISDYFSSRSLKVINIDDIDGSIKMIEDAINNHLWEYSQTFLRESQLKIISKYHPYQIYSSIMKNLPLSKYREVIIKPHNFYNYDLTSRLRMKLISLRRKFHKPKVKT